MRGVLPGVVLVVSLSLAGLGGCGEEPAPTDAKPVTTTTTASSTGTGGASGGDPTGGGSPTGGQGGVPSGAGKMTITANDLDAYQGKQLKAVVLDPTGSKDFAALCVPIETATVSGVAKKKLSQDMCDLGKEIDLPEGDYFVFAGIFTEGGSAEVCMEASVALAADVEVVLPPPGKCSD